MLDPDSRSQWMLADNVAFLNHGSFGAVPKVVFEEQDRWRRRIEADPVEIIGRRLPDLIHAAKKPLADSLHVTPDEFGLITNATEGVNAVLQSLAFKPGDELLTTNHVYNAVRQAMRHAAVRSGAIYREIEVPTPVGDADQILRPILNQLSGRTRLLLIDHITSPTGLIFPVEQIVQACNQRGIETLIDGAHAPGMIDLDIPATGATYYAGNLHKWCCAPKGSAFLWVAPHRRNDIHPCVISHNYGKGLAEEFAWQGTRDVSAWLAIPAALQFMSNLGWPRVRAHNHGLAVWAHQTLVERWNVEPLSPLDGSLLGATVTLPLPRRLADLSEADGKALQQSLYTDHAIEVPLFYWQNRWHLRVSCQVYNRQNDYDRLAQAIASLV